MLNKNINGALTDDELDKVGGGIDISGDTRSAKCMNANCGNYGNRVVGPAIGPIICPECHCDCETGAYMGSDAGTAGSGIKTVSSVKSGVVSGGRLNGSMLA